MSRTVISVSPPSYPAGSGFNTFQTTDFNTFKTNNYDTMPVPPHVEPNANLSKAQKIAKMVFLYLFDFLLVLYIIPRGVKLTVRLASMIFLKMTAVSLSIWIQYVLVMTLQANKGLVEPTTLTMSAERLLGLPEAPGCNNRVRREVRSTWEDLLGQTDEEEVSKIKVDFPDLDESTMASVNATYEPSFLPSSWNTTAAVNSTAEHRILDENVFIDFNVTAEEVELDEEIHLTDLDEPDGSFTKASNKTLDNPSQAARNSHLIDTTLEILTNFFELQEQDVEPQRLPLASDEDNLDEYALDLLEMLTDTKPSAKRSTQQLKQKEGEEKKKSRCRCPKLLSRQDLKILAAALTSSLFVSMVVIIGLCCTRKSKQSRRPSKEEDPEQAEMQTTSL